MKGFYISVNNGLIEDKHRVAMGEAIWLYMLLLDKMTSVTESGIGKVLGGKPLKYEDVQEFYPLLPRTTYVRYVAILKTAGYIETIRTPRGLVFKVLKAKKIFNSDVPKKTHHKRRDVPKKTHHKKSDVPKMEHAEDVPKMEHAIRQDSLDKTNYINTTDVVYWRVIKKTYQNYFMK
jgi:hypothetical protein